MKTLKAPMADLDRFRTIFFEIGLILTLCFVLILFHIKTYEKSKTGSNSLSDLQVQEEFVSITTQDVQPPPPAPPQQTTLLQIVANEQEITQDIEINVEADQETEVEDYIPFIPEETREEEAEQNDQVFIVVESMPEFPGGDSARLTYLYRNLTYPLIAREAGIQGVVYLTFVVEKDGRITNVRLLRGIGGGCDEEAIRVVQQMPNWNPGKQRNIPVRVQFNMPVRFILY